MDRLPAAISGVLNCFARAFSRRVWARAQLLVVGAILCPGARTVAPALRVLELPRSGASPATTVR